MAITRRTVQAGIDPLLTNFIVDFANNQKDYFGDKLFPVVNVSHETGTYYTFSSTKDRFAFPQHTARAVGGVYGRGQLDIGTATFATIEDGWEIPVDKRLQETAVDPFDPWRTAVRKATDIILLRREYNVISAITNATTFASYTAAVGAANRFDNTASEPVQYIDSISETIRGNCGQWPNTMVIDWATWLKLKEHPVVIDRIKLTQDKIVTTDLLARLFNVERLFVSKAKYNSAEEGQTVSLTDLMSKKCFLGYVAPAPAIDMPSVGYLIQKEGFVAETYYEDRTRSDITRARINEVPKIVAAECGYLLTTVIS